MLLIGEYDEATVAVKKYADAIISATTLEQLTKVTASKDLSKLITSSYKYTTTKKPSKNSSSTKSTSAEKDYERLYNLIEDINAEQKRYNQLKEDADNITRSEIKHSQDLLKNLEGQRDSLIQQRAYYEQLKKAREEVLQESLDKYKSVSSLITVVNGAVQIDYEKLAKTTNEGTKEFVKAAEEEYQKELDGINDCIKGIDECDDGLDELYKAQRDIIIDFEAMVREALNNWYQLEIDAQNTVADAIKSSNADLIKSVQDNISKLRQDRENQRTEEELAQKRRRLAYLQLDTSGANALTIKQLQEELAQGEETYTDKLIDQKVNELQSQNDEAAQQRQEQIDILTNQLEWLNKTGEINQRVLEIIDAGITDEGVLIEGSQLSQILDRFKLVQEMTSKEIEKNVDELSSSVKEYIAAVKYSNEESFKTLTAAVNKNNNSYISGGSGSNGGATSSGGSKSGGSGSGANGSNDKTPKSMSATGAATSSGFSKTVQAGHDVPRIVTIGGKQYINLDGAWYLLDDITAIGKGDRVYYTVASGTKQYLAKYATGGLADYTGPAWLDGSPTKPELVLNPKDTENFIQLKDILAKSQLGQNNTTFGNNMFNISIDVAQLANDYDVDQMVSRVQQKIEEASRYRNGNAISLMR